MNRKESLESLYQMLIENVSMYWADVHFLLWSSVFSLFYIDAVLWLWSEENLKALEFGEK